MEPEFKREFDRLHREIKALMAVQEKATWVPANWILEITGWTPRRLQTAREQKIVEVKEYKSGYLYKLESIPEIFLKKQAS